MTDLIEWLRQQIAGDAEQWQLILSGPRKNGKGIARDRLAQCEAHSGLLDLIEADVVDDGEAVVPREMLMNLGLAYQHRPGYRPEWRP